MKTSRLFLLFLTILLFREMEVNGQQLNARFGINTNGWYMGIKAGIIFTSNGPVAVQNNITGYGSMPFSRTNLIFDNYLNTVQCYSTGYCFYDQISSQIYTSYPSGWPILCDSLGYSGGGYSVILPSSNDSMIYYIFTISTISNNTDCIMNWAGIQYNGQNFELISEDSMFVPNYPQQDFGVVRHGNGKDFWLLFHRYGGNTTTNEFMSVLFNDGIIVDTIIQNIGTPLNTVSSIQFNHSGNKVAILNSANSNQPFVVSELYDFNRCTGFLSNLDTIRVHQYPNYGFASGAFSPNDSLLYISAWDTLFQFQVNAPNLASSVIPIYTATAINNDYRYPIKLAVGPDKKLYASIYSNLFTVDSAVGYLDVINYPDVIGTPCYYQPYAVYLGGNRTNGTLPYIYEYDKGPLVNSPCDTIYNTVGLTAVSTNPKITLYPNPVENVLNIQEVNNKPFELQVEVYNTMGTKIRVEQVSLPASLSTLDLKPGIYQIVVKEYNGTVVKSQKLMCIK